MKIAIPTKQSKVESSFSNCECFSIYEIENNMIIKQEVLNVPPNNRNESELVDFLSGNKVSVLLVRKIGVDTI